MKALTSKMRGMRKRQLESLAGEQVARRQWNVYATVVERERWEGGDGSVCSLGTAGRQMNVQRYICKRRSKGGVSRLDVAENRVCVGTGGLTNLLVIPGMLKITMPKKFWKIIGYIAVRKVFIFTNVLW